MSDDGFIREVNEEMRRDKASALWARFGPMAIALAVLIVLVTSLFVAWEYWMQNRAGRDGDAFSQALSMAEQGKSDEAIAALAKLEADGHGAYPMLARMRSATALAEKGDGKAAVAAFDAVAADNAAPQAVRDMARVRAALLLVDQGTYADVSARVEQLAADNHSLRHSARESLGLSAWKEGKRADALKLFDQIVADEQAPRNVRERATIMAGLIRGAGDAS